MKSLPTQSAIRRRINLLLWIFVAGLVISGATALPLETELRLLTQTAKRDVDVVQHPVTGWVAEVRDALAETNTRYPFLAHGTDWLAFAHFAIAIAFIGPLRDPIKNVWVVEFGMIACVLVVPFALVMGGVRGIPMGWRLIDCSFGVIGVLPLWYCRRLISELAWATDLPANELHPPGPRVPRVTQNTKPGE